MPQPFRALQYPAAIDARTGRFIRETDYDRYVSQLVRQVLLTAPGSRINRPTFGAGLRHFIMAPNSPGVASLVQTLVFQALTTWLGSIIIVNDVRATANNERLDVLVAYTIRARGEQRELSLEVTL